MIGVEHFFLYVMDETLDGWPDMDYITYIPFNLNPKMRGNYNIFLFQIAAQVNAIHRGRSYDLDWITMNDMDEYWVPRAGNITFREYLDAHRNDEISGIQGETVAFGNPPKTKERQPLLLDYVWRGNKTFGKRDRVKCVVRPRLVDYYQIHWITGHTGSVFRANHNELWIHHYKRPKNGVFQAKPGDITMDTSLRDQFSAAVGNKVDAILSQIKESTAAVYNA